MTAGELEALGPVVGVGRPRAGGCSRSARPRRRRAAAQVSALVGDGRRARRQPRGFRRARPVQAAWRVSSSSTARAAMAGVGGSAEMRVGAHLAERGQLRHRVAAEAGRRLGASDGRRGSRGPSSADKRASRIVGEVGGSGTRARSSRSSKACARPGWLRQPARMALSRMRASAEAPSGWRASGDARWPRPAGRRAAAREARGAAAGRRAAQPAGPGAKRAARRSRISRSQWARIDGIGDAGEVGAQPGVERRRGARGCRAPGPRSRGSRSGRPSAATRRGAPASRPAPPARTTSSGSWPGGHQREAQRAAGPSSGRARSISRWAAARPARVAVERHHRLGGELPERRELVLGDRGAERGHGVRRCRPGPARSRPCSPRPRPPSPALRAAARAGPRL